MAQLIEESLLEAIKKDDIEAFDALMKKARCGTFRLGRFPVLSLMYLYSSRKLLAVYEEKFIKIPGYEELREPVEVSSRFSKRAGKCLRLYLNEVVTPLEMLLILDRTRRLTRIYPLTNPSSAVKARLKSIYSIRYSLGVNFEGDRIIIDRKPLSLRAKKNIAAVCLCSVFAVGAVIGVPVTVNEFKIDFASQKEYTLKRDIVISKPLKEFNCKIIGNGHKITVKKGVTLGACNGHVSDLTIESYGGAAFTTVSASSTVKNVTVNVNADIEAAAGTALLAVTNYGTIDGVTVNVSGRMHAIAPSAEDVDFTCGGIVQYNLAKSQQVYGVIKNCAVSYSRFELSGESEADASFGGVAGVNSGYLQDCTVTGEIKADTFDVAGVCSVNNGVLLNNVNGANLSQASANTGWNPIVSGIVLTNNSDVLSCENRGSISAKSTSAKPEEGAQVPTVSAAGVVYTNNGRIESCKNSGAITVGADSENAIFAAGIATITYGYINKSVNEGAISATGGGAAYAGGISAQSDSRITTCISNGDISVSADKLYVGGILGFSLINSYGHWGAVDYCICESKISAVAGSDESCYVGGVAGIVQQGRFTTLDLRTVYAGGGVTNSYFTGECATGVKYFGGIVGTCGAELYESNSYIPGFSEYLSFNRNYYLNNNSSTAFGATVTTVDEEEIFVKVEDKGAKAATEEEIEKTPEYQAIKRVLNIN